MMERDVAVQAFTGEIMDRMPEVAVIRVGLPTAQECALASEAVKALLAKDVTPK